MTDNFDLKKFITEAKLKIKVPVKEMARIAKEKYRLNPDFPQIKDRIKNPSDFKLDRKQQVVNYFVSQANKQDINPMEVELLKSEIEKNSAPGVNWSFTPDIRNQLLQTTSIKSAPGAPEEEPSEDDMFSTAFDAEDMFVGGKKLKSKKAIPAGEEGDEEPSEKDIVKVKAPRITAAGSKAGEWFMDNDDLISKIIKQYSQSQVKTGRTVKEAEDGGLSSADFKSAQQASKERAKTMLPDLVQKLVDSLEKLKDEDYNVYVKVLNDLDKYKFSVTNTKNVMRMILKALGETKIPAIGSKRKNNDDELKKLGIDDEPIDIDGEEEL
jgi:hypothetical protein